jgi:hypothetical protein
VGAVSRGASRRVWIYGQSRNRGCRGCRGRGGGRCCWMLNGWWGSGSGYGIDFAVALANHALVKKHSHEAQR